ncbi:hypothetical protein GIV34_09620 [Pseudomonas sp. PA-1-6A]|uniref:hypothetical protein n=1 Tax=Pseudomonas sp. PA-1-6A TaxID=2665467 RepID=UPI001F3D2662|nr:hypothetical protein [Pseudomonas sp. PA-1-6A]MCF5834272.1 hypothetical protein [Pseudomonas sp. PA-1-6A]
MKREHVKARHAEGQISATHVIQNPADLGEWIVFFKKSGGRSYFLGGGQGGVGTFARLDDLIEILRGLGVKFAEVHL